MSQVFSTTCPISTAAWVALGGTMPYVLDHHHLAAGRPIYCLEGQTRSKQISLKPLRLLHPEWCTLISGRCAGRRPRSWQDLYGLFSIHLYWSSGSSRPFRNSRSKAKLSQTEWWLAKQWICTSNFKPLWISKREGLNSQSCSPSFCASWARSLSGLPTGVFFPGDGLCFSIVKLRGSWPWVNSTNHCLLQWILMFVHWLQD